MYVQDIEWRSVDWILWLRETGNVDTVMKFRFHKSQGVRHKRKPICEELFGRVTGSYSTKF